MSEDAKWLTIILLITLLIGYITYSLVVAGVSYTDEAYVKVYRAEIDENLNLLENYLYQIEVPRYHMLYRFWKAPLYREGEGTPPYIGIITVMCKDQEATPYFTDAEGDHHILGEVNDWTQYWVKKSYPNEVGCIYTEGIPVGTHELRASYIIHPPLKCDQSRCLLELSLADEHIPYYSFEITVYNRNNGIVSIEALGDDISIRSEGDRYIITGRSPENTALKLYILYNREAAPKTAKIESTIDAQLDYYWLVITQAWTRRMLQTCALILPFIVPLVVIPLIYWRWGRELEEPVVPEYLHYVPNPKMKPWQVNLLFKGDATKMDYDAVTATILDLARKGYLKLMGTSSEDLAIQIQKRSPIGLDDYEERVLELLKTLSINNILTPKNIPQRVRSMSISEKTHIHSMLASLREYRGAKSLVKKYITSPRSTFFVVATLLFFAPFILLFITGLFDPYVTEPWATIMSFMPWPIAIQLFLVGIAPAQVFGRWKPGKYREKLEWDAFKRMLRDLAKLPQYHPQDLAVWKEWLVYGTALGVGENVSQAMYIKGIHVPDVYVPTTLTPVFYTVYSLSRPPSSSSGGGGGFGGGVGGGGFGGGGAGVR